MAIANRSFVWSCSYLILFLGFAHLKLKMLHFRFEAAVLDTSSSTSAPIHIDPIRAKAFAAAVYEGADVPIDEVRVAADTFVQADLWGHQSHGLLRLPWFYARLMSGAMKANTQMKLAVDAGAVAVLDRADGAGAMIARHAVDQAFERVRLHGVRAVAVRNSNHFGTCTYHTRMVGEQGFIMVLMSNAGPNMAP